MHFKEAVKAAEIEWVKETQQELGDLVKVEEATVEGTEYRLTFAAKDESSSEITFTVISQPWEHV